MSRLHPADPAHNLGTARPRRARPVLRARGTPSAASPGTPKLTPFVGARVQWARESATVAGTSLSGNGLGFGGVGGFQYSASPQLAIEAAVLYVSQNLGEVKSGGVVVNPSTSGTVLGLQFGLVFSFGAK